MNLTRVLIICLIVIGMMLLGMGFYIVSRPVNNESGNNSVSVPFSNTSTTQNSHPKCVISNPTGSCWTISNPPATKSVSLPSDSEFSKPSVVVKDNVCTFIVPASEENGVRGCPLTKGQAFEITAGNTVRFSDDHPRVDADGMKGWYDPNVDSPFTQNVGGLEFAYGSLQANRYFAGTHYSGIAEADGELVFRVIERKIGYHDNNSGGFTVKVIRK